MDRPQEALFVVLDRCHERAVAGNQGSNVKNYTRDARGSQYTDRGEREMAY